MRGRIATPLALVAAIAIFAGAFVLTRSLLWSPLLAAVGAVGLYLMIDSRRPHEVSDDEYEEDAERKVDDVLRIVKEIRKSAEGVISLPVRQTLQQSCDYVPELLNRVRTGSPSTLFSSASQLGAHLTSLAGALKQYLDIQRNPAFYTDAPALMAGGEAAFGRFAEFTVESLKLVNAGDLAQYQANLATVAPPKLPQL
jgi:hypothetical protein